MKKRCLLPAAIFPCTALLVPICVRDGTVIERYFHNNIFLFLLPFLLWWLLAFLLTARAANRAVKQGVGAAELIKCALTLKLLTLPANAAVLLLCVGFLLTAWVFLLLPLTLMGLLSSLLTGLMGRAAILQGAKEGIFTRRDADIHGVLILLFGFEVYSTLFLWRHRTHQPNFKKS